jgi:hypothetical protein
MRVRAIRVCRDAEVLREEPPDLGRAQALLVEVLALPELRLELPIARERLVAISLALDDRRCFVEIEHLTERWTVLTTISRADVDEILTHLFAGRAPDEIPLLRDAQWTGGPLPALRPPE